MNDHSAATRRTVYHVLITVAVALVCGRILSATLVYEPALLHPDPKPAVAAELATLAAQTPLDAALYLSAGERTWGKFEGKDAHRFWPRELPTATPMFGSNDRSRWATIRALVDEGTFVIGKRVTDPATGKFRDSGIVFEDGWQSIDKVLRPDSKDDVREFFSSKPPLLTTMVAGVYWILHKTLGWSITTERWQVVRVTLLVVSALPLAIYLLLLAQLLERYGRTDWGRLFVLASAGFGTFLTTFALTLNNHTIAACTALFALYPALRIWGDGRREWWNFALAGFFASFTACIELPATSFAVLLALVLLTALPRRTLAAFLPAAALPVAALFATNYLALGQWRLAYGEFGGPWYEYAGSPWQIVPGLEKTGIDWAYLHESRATYAFHLLLGHHGLLSLSPIWLLAIAGMLLAVVHTTRRGSPATDALPRAWQGVALLTLVLTIIVLGFFIVVVPDRNRNYGGWTNGPRWLFWLTPFWLLTLLPVADWLALRRWGRTLGLLLLAVAVFSASYRPWNPWRHPWLYNVMETFGWPGY